MWHFFQIRHLVIFFFRNCSVFSWIVRSDAISGQLCEIAPSRNIRWPDFECLWREIYYLLENSFQNDEEWYLFYCDSKLDQLWRHNVDSYVKSQKNEYLSHFLYRTETLYSGYTHHKVQWYVHCDISMATQCVPGSIQMVKSEVLSFTKGYLLLLFIQWVWANIDITQNKHKKVSLVQQIRHFSFQEGRGLVTSMLLWWHHNHYHNV